MKKNIVAVLLVITLSTAALFADPVSFDVSTQVAGLNYLAITDAEFTGTTMGAWNTFMPANTVEGAVPITTSPLAYVNVVNNKRAGVAVYVKADKMEANTSGNNYKIDYSVTVNGATYSTATSTANVMFVTAAQSAATSGLFLESYPVTAAVVQTSFDNAPEDTYVGTITFTFSAT